MVAAVSLLPDPEESARSAGLCYVSDDGPGIVRRRSGGHFRYVDPNGRAVRDAATLGRIRSLAIPPAWDRVWICPSPNGHLQATGRDARGRKQYRYHPRWREVRDETKYHRVVAFASALPKIRARIDDDLARPGLPMEKVLATVVSLLEATLIRVGNEEYARQNHSYGLTTLEDRHVQVVGTTLRFRFRGKSGVRHEVDLRDRRLAAIVRRCQELPGHELFHYVDDDGATRPIESGDVNAWLHAVAGEEFTAKDFRTWAGTVHMALELSAVEPARSATHGRRLVASAVKRVAARLRNTPSVCRNCYVHPAIVEGYMEGDLADSLRKEASSARGGGGLRPEERAVLCFLERRAGDSAAGPKLVRSTRAPQIRAKRVSGEGTDRRRLLPTR